MAAKGNRPGRLETEIEKYRGDGNWSRVLDLSRQLSAKTPHLGNCRNIFVFVYSQNVNSVQASFRIRVGREPGRGGAAGRLQSFSALGNGVGLVLTLTLTLALTVTHFTKY